MRLLFLSLILLVLGGNSFAEVWHVERDGSGDFSFLQEAADVAASGDTILVGSGRYDEWQLYGNYTQYPARMIIESKDLVVIGENDGSTIIGPDDLIGEPNHHGIVLISDNNVVIRNIQFTNLDGGVISWVGGSIEAYGCGFSDTHRSFRIAAGRGGVFGCNFRNTRAQTYQVKASFADELVVDNCVFETSLTSSHLVLAGTPVTINGCNFIGGGVAMNIDRSAQVWFRNCSISDSRYCFVLGVGAPDVEVVDCVMSQLDVMFYGIHAGSSFKMDSCIVTDVGTATLVAGHLDQGYVRNCILAKGDRGVVLYYNHLNNNMVMMEEVVSINEFDMRNNDWGTTDPDSIQALIDDCNDDQVIGYRILWEPYIGQPVGTDDKSFDSLKSLFR